MAVERKMGAKRLMDFSPGQKAVTLLDAVAPEEAPVGCKGEAPPQQIVEAPSRQGTPGLKGVIVYLA